MVRALFVVVALSGCVTSHAYNVQKSGEPLAYDWAAFRQGTIAIDEHDFYRIGGDREAADKIEHERATGDRYNKVGWVIALVGLASLAYGAAASDSRGYGGALLLPIGGTMAFYGRARADRHPQLSGERARQVAARYNAALGIRSAP